MTFFRIHVETDTIDALYEKLETTPIRDHSVDSIYEIRATALLELYNKSHPDRAETTIQQLDISDDGIVTLLLKSKATDAKSRNGWRNHVGKFVSLLRGKYSTDTYSVTQLDGLINFGKKDPKNERTRTNRRTRSTKTISDETGKTRGT